MAVLPMKRVRICALKKDRKQILEILQRRGVVELANVLQEDSVFQKTDISASKITYEKNSSVAAQALAVLNQHAPEKTPMLAMLNGRRELSSEEYEIFSAERDEVMRVAYRLSTLAKEIAENTASIPKLEAQTEALAPWLTLDIPLGFKGTKKTAAFIGLLPGEITQQTLYSEFNRLDPDFEALNIDLISTSKEQTCIFLMCAVRKAAFVEETLRALGFARPAMLSGNVTPSKRKLELEQQITELRAGTSAAEAEIASYRGLRNALKFTIDYYSMRGEKYEVIGRMLYSRRVFVLEGYIPAREVIPLEAKLASNYELALDFSNPGETEDIPVLLQNNSFVTPVESVVESYSLPSKGEVDPTTIMAGFYYALFGLMLSDAAYGLIMVLGCGFCLWKYKTMESGMHKMLKMFFFCGISTMFWGILFGSYFGDVVDVVSQTFFGVHLTIPALWFVPVNEPIRMLVFAFLVGVIHLFTGLGVKLYQCIKSRRYADGLYDVIFWYMLVGGGIVYLLTMSMFTDMMGLTFILPAWAGTIAAVAAGIAAVGIIFTAGRESRNWGKRLLKGLYGLYNVSGYLSDILSYSRLLALGLATGVIATVFNKMGSMMGGGVLGAILFIFVFLVGHSLNIGINLLGAYVHTNRLQFVEFFGKFYEGGGRKFTPFAMNTKYYKIREDI